MSSSPANLHFFWSTAPVYGDRQDDVVDHHAGTQIAVVKLNLQYLKRLEELIQTQTGLSDHLPDNVRTEHTNMTWEPVQYARASRKELDALDRSSPELRRRQEAFFEWCNEQYSYKGANVERYRQKGLIRPEVVQALVTEPYRNKTTASILITSDLCEFRRLKDVQKGKGTGAQLTRSDLLVLQTQLAGPDLQKEILDQLIEMEPQKALWLLEGVSVIGQEHPFREPPELTSRQAQKLLQHPDQQIRQQALVSLKNFPGQPTRQHTQR